MASDRPEICRDCGRLFSNLPTTDRQKTDTSICWWPVACAHHRGGLVEGDRRLQKKVREDWAPTVEGVAGSGGWLLLLWLLVAVALAAVVTALIGELTS